MNSVGLEPSRLGKISFLPSIHLHSSTASRNQILLSYSSPLHIVLHWSHCGFHFSLTLKLTPVAFVFIESNPEQRSLLFFSVFLCILSHWYPSSSPISFFSPDSSLKLRNSVITCNLESAILLGFQLESKQFRLHVNVMIRSFDCGLDCWLAELGNLAGFYLELKEFSLHVIILGLKSFDCGLDYAYLMSTFLFFVVFSQINTAWKVRIERVWMQVIDKSVMDKGKELWMN